jgi:hypothetical protein
MRIDLSMARLIVALVLLAGLLPAASASAQDCQAPPGTAAIDQYCETIPAAGGDRGTGERRASVPLSAATVRKLRNSGEQGEALLRQLGRNPAKRDRGTKSPAPSAPTHAAGAPSNNPLDAVSSALSSGPTLGGGFIAALLGVTLLMLTWGWIAYRRRTGE